MQFIWHTLLRLKLFTEYQRPTVGQRTAIKIVAKLFIMVIRNWQNMSFQPDNDPYFEKKHTCFDITPHHNYVYCGCSHLCSAYELNRRILLSCDISSVGLKAPYFRVCWYSVLCSVLDNITSKRNTNIRHRSQLVSDVFADIRASSLDGLTEQLLGSL